MARYLYHEEFKNLLLQRRKRLQQLMTEELRKVKRKQVSKEMDEFQQRELMLQDNFSMSEDDTSSLDFNQNQNIKIETMDKIQVFSGLIFFMLLIYFSYFSIFTTD